MLCLLGDHERRGAGAVGSLRAGRVVPVLRDRRRRGACLAGAGPGMDAAVDGHVAGAGRGWGVAGQGPGAAPVAGCEPVRRFSWGRRQRHRPGLQFMVSTGRVHGFESLEEQALLLALDFTGALEDVLPQPFTLRFGTADSGFLKHVPDFLAVFRDGSRWLLDVRPARLVGENDATCFAAAAEAALEAGWRYSVVAGWRPHVRTGIDALSAQRRGLQDRPGPHGPPLGAAAAGAAPAGGLVGATPLPAVARAHALHLLWRRRLGTDLSRPLGDASLVWLAGGNG